MMVLGYDGKSQNIPERKETTTFNYVFVGDERLKSPGISSLINSFVKGYFDPTHSGQTVKTLASRDTQVLVRLFDKASNHETLTSNLAKADVVFIVGDMTNGSTLEATFHGPRLNSVHRYVTQYMSKQAKVVLVGTKCDEKRMWKLEELTVLGKYIEAAGVFEVSAKTGRNVYEMFQAVTDLMVDTLNLKTETATTKPLENAGWKGLGYTPVNLRQMPLT